MKNEIDFTTEWNPGGANADMETNPEHLTGIGCQVCHTKKPHIKLGLFAVINVKTNQ